MIRRLIQSGIAISFLTLGSTLAANAQTQQISPPQSNGVGNLLSYPNGSRIYQNGTIITPNSGTIFPSNTIRNGDGSTTFYYQNGTKITTQGNSINPSGTFLNPGFNGGLRNGMPTNSQPPFQNR